MTDHNWQALALSEHVNAETPLPVYLENKPVALFRDQDGTVCAVEDYCPHRRIPLSLGKIIKGQIRCAYHGWTFDGKSGKCAAIPNLNADESPSERYRIATYHVREENGFIYLRDKDGPPLPFAKTNFASTPHLGKSTVPFGIQPYQSALLDGPQVLLSIHGVGFSDFYLGDPVWEDGVLLFDRPADWVKAQKSIEPSKWAHDYPMILRTEFHPRSNMTKLTLMNIREQAFVTLLLAAATGPRGTTQIIWRALSHENAPKRLRGTSLKIEVFDHLDGAALATLLIGPSERLNRDHILAAQ